MHSSGNISVLRERGRFPLLSLQNDPFVASQTGRDGLATFLTGNFSRDGVRVG